MPDDVRLVPPGEWVEQAAAVFGDTTYGFDWLSACDEIGAADQFRVVVRFDRADGHGIRLETGVSRMAPQLQSLRQVIAGVVWHERATHDLFGIEFVGGDARPLLIPAEGFPGHPGGYPYRKDFVLAARAVTPWPADSGGAEDARRRQPPPGVPDPAVWGHRPADAGPPDPAEIVAGTGRRRR